MLKIHGRVEEVQSKEADNHKKREQRRVKRAYHSELTTTRLVTLAATIFLIEATTTMKTNT